MCNEQISKQGKQQKQDFKYINKTRLISPDWIHKSYPVRMHLNLNLMYCNMDRRIQRS